MVVEKIVLRCKEEVSRGPNHQQPCGNFSSRRRVCMLALVPGGGFRLYQTSVASWASHDSALTPSIGTGCLNTPHLRREAPPPLH